ncbi:TPA_asm: cytosine permease [Listeria monocytogenes]|uniref:cytosine permease n=1 Tax=Listeria monocytogenes TaxID=1639 RepID=UPI00083D73F9|nr:cytosine permease [Listeria monocytogenes]EAC3991374.1 cytosine permease [Listeria monocytogenes]EAG6807053.1 cytosine permease [Listeria monocytogenes]EAK8414383.1 cytosine permease [Listeria monocytogenes]ODB25124.1 cytosine permease [Listeria monocytogenes]ODC46739.1 cytosine permease [Listeria monocytogenes]
MTEKKTVEQAQSWQSLAFVWTGAMICVPSLLVGGTLISGMPLWEAILIALLGYGVIVVFMIYQGMQSSDLGIPAVSVASQVFGEQGSKKIISILLAIACLGWFGIQANVCGAAFSQFLGIYGINLPVPVSSLIWGVIMLLSAIYGIRILSILNYIAVPILLFVCIYGLVVSLNNGGLAVVENYKPAGSMSFMTGLAITIGSFALGAVIAGDYSQYTKSRKDVVKAAIVGILPSGVLMIAVGAILALTAGTADISVVFTNLGLPVLGIIGLILAAWTTNAVNAFSGGIAIINVFNISEKYHKVAVAIAGGLGTVLAVIGILNHFVPIMSVLSAMVPPVAGVMIASYWIVQKGDKSKWAPVPGVNWLGVTSWLVGAVIAGIPVILTFFPALPQLPNQPLIGIILSLAVYLVGAEVLSGKTNNVENLEGK